MPYQLRYLIALVAWALLLCGALILKFFLIWCIPIIWVWTSFGYRQSQMSAQATASLADMFIYNWPRFPRADWRRLLGRRSPADRHARLPEKLGNSRI